MIRRPPRSTPWSSSAASDVYKRQVRTSPMVYHARYVPVLWCLTLRKYQSHCVPRSGRTGPMVYHDQFVPVPWCTTLRTSHCVHAQCVGYQSHGVPHSVRTSSIVYHAVNIHQPSRSLGSSREKLLKIPKASLKTFDQFSFLVPRVWNSLPADQRNAVSLACFRSRLKTHLLRLALN